MNVKNSIVSIVILFLFFVVFFCAGFGAGYRFGSHVAGGKNPADNGGIEANIARERELLGRIGEYERREEERNRREAERITAEGERIKRTENAIRAVRELNRRSGSLLEELEQEINILAGYFRDSRDGLYNELNNSGSE